MKKNYWKSALAYLCIFALAVGLLSVAAFAAENDTIHVNGEKRVFTAEGELSSILKLPVETPGKIHILVSGMNTALAIYNESTFELCGVYTTENGLMDVPFDAVPGTYLLGFSGWGEVAVLVADENTVAQQYANIAAAAEEVAEEPSEEDPVEGLLEEESAEEPAEEVADELIEEPVEEPEEEPAEESAEEDLPLMGKGDREAVDEVYPAAEESLPPEETPAEPAEELAEEAVEEMAEVPSEEIVEEPAEEPADGEPLDEEPIEEPVEEAAEESVEAASEDAAKKPAEEEPVEEIVEETSEEETVEELAEETVEETLELSDFYDPSLPIFYEFTSGSAVSVLSILNEVGVPANMVREVTRDSDGYFSSFGSSDGDWLLTPFAYFDSKEVSVKAGYFNVMDGSIKDADYTLVLSYPDPAQAPAEEIAEEIAEEAADKVAEEPVEEVAEEPAEEPTLDEPSPDGEGVSPEELTDEVIPEEPAVEEPVNEEPAAEEPIEEPAEEPVYYDPSVPIYYEFTGGGTVSVLSILNGVGAPVNMVQELTRETDGWFFATGSSDGDWLLTPYAYFDSMDVSVKAAYFDPADASITSADYTLVLSYPDPAAEAEETVESELPAKEVIIAMERLEGNEIRLYAENLEPEEIEAFTYRWQSSQDSENWVDIDGANSSEYVFTLNSINGSYYWRLIVSKKDGF